MKSLPKTQIKQLRLLAEVNLSVIRLINLAPDKHRMMLVPEKRGLAQRVEDGQSWEITDAGRAAIQSK